MMPANVCAVIITFRPGGDVLHNLARLRPQVEGMVVVDNGSSAEQLRPLRAAAQGFPFALIEHGGNLGVAAALNTGVRWAKDQGYEFVLLFDQDSTVTEGFRQAMLAAYQLSPQPERVAVVTPCQLEKNTGQMRRQGRAKDGGPLVAITSGSLMASLIFDRCGWFQEDLVIDCVDHEYCLRARALGYTLVACPQAVLQVTVGAEERHRAFGRTVQARHHNAPRRYYLTRNRLVMIQRFWRQEPRWCCRTLQDIVQDAVKVILLEEDAWPKTRNTARGIYDALFGRMGKVVELS